MFNDKFFALLAAHSLFIFMSIRLTFLFLFWFSSFCVIAMRGDREENVLCGFRSTADASRLSIQIQWWNTMEFQRMNILVEWKQKTGATKKWVWKGSAYSWDKNKSNHITYTRTQICICAQIDKKCKSKIYAILHPIPTAHFVHIRRRPYNVRCT